MMKKLSLKDSSILEYIYKHLCLYVHVSLYLLPIPTYRLGQVIIAIQDSFYRVLRVMLKNPCAQLDT